MADYLQIHFTRIISTMWFKVCWSLYASPNYNELRCMPSSGFREKQSISVKHIVWHIPLNFWWQVQMSQQVPRHSLTFAICVVFHRDQLTTNDVFLLYQNIASWSNWCHWDWYQGIEGDLFRLFLKSNNCYQNATRIRIYKRQNYAGCNL